MLKYSPSPTLVLAAILAATSVTGPTTRLPQRAIGVAPAYAQPTPSFAMPETVPQGTQVRISGGSDSMMALSTVLKNGFENQFAGSAVTLRAMGADAALAALTNGQSDLAAISRPLTTTEKAQGLVEVPVRRVKIAVVVSAENPFQGSLTGNQFAEIFRGQITDWSEVGGPAGSIRLIDRPPASEVRLALTAYPVFQAVPFQTETTATQLSEESPAALTKTLGKNGIGYALVTELQGVSGMRALELHRTPPTSPQYPFSQPFSFIYKGQPSPAVVAFLGYVTSEVGQRTAAQVDLANPTATLATATPAEHDLALGGRADKAARETAEVTPARGGQGNGAPGAVTEGHLNAAGGADQNAVNTPAVNTTGGTIGPVTPDLAASEAAGNAGDGAVEAGGPLPDYLLKRQGWWLCLPIVVLGLILWAVKRRQDGVTSSQATVDALIDAAPTDGDVAPSVFFPDRSTVDVEDGSIDEDFQSPSRELTGWQGTTAAGTAHTAAGLVTQNHSEGWSDLAHGAKGRLYGMPEDANGTVQVGVDRAVSVGQHSLETPQEYGYREVNDGNGPGQSRIRGMTDRVMGASYEAANPAKQPATKGQANPLKTSAELDVQLAQKASRNPENGVDATDRRHF